MSLVLRRALSWLVTLAVAAALALSITRLPGAGGLEAELRWLFGRGDRAALNEAAALLHVSEEQTPGTRLHILAALLRDPNDGVVRGTLTFVADLVAYRWGSSTHENDDARTVYREWLAGLSDQRRLELLGPLVNCIAGYWEALEPGEWKHECRRWLVAATIAVDPRLQARACELLWARQAEVDVIDRLRTLDGQAPRWQQRGARDSAPNEPGAWGALELLDVDEYVTLLTDPVPQVRWAAGRILAVCRDSRALPAVHEWLQNAPNVPAEARAVLDQVFGVDWRTPFESGRATSQSSRRNGGS
ncbi:MAG: hypothetical protein KKB50_03905 [Planctomycetes bacterium]|nr:hypothetical protein [Planctomycetota bacterium]